MIQVYLLDAQHVYAGTAEIDPYAPIPMPSTMTAPPELDEGQYARWVGYEWEVLDEYPTPAPVLSPVPQQVTRAQGKAALIQAGLWAAVESYVSSIADPTEKALAEVALNDTTHWRRDSPFLNAAADALGLAEGQLDDLFRAAAQINL